MSNTVKKNLFKKYKKVLGDYEYVTGSLSTVYTFKNFTVDITPRPNYDGNEALILLYRPIEQVLETDYSEGKFHVDLTPIVFAAPIKLSKTVNGQEEPIKVFSEEGGEKVYELLTKLLPRYYYYLGDFMGSRYKYYTTALKLMFQDIALSGADSVAGTELDFLALVNYKDTSDKNLEFNEKLSAHLKELLTQIVNYTNKNKLPHFALELEESIFHSGRTKKVKLVSMRLSVTARSIQDVPQQFPLNYNAGIFLSVGLNLMHYIDYKIREFIEMNSENKEQLNKEGV